MEHIDPDPDPWTTSQLDLSLVSTLQSCLLISGHHLTLSTVTRPVLGLRSHSWLGFITMDLTVPHLCKSIWSPGPRADLSCRSWAFPALCPAGQSPCWLSQHRHSVWLPVLWGAAISHRLLTLTENTSSHLWHGLKPGQLGKLNWAVLALCHSPMPGWLLISYLTLQTSFRVQHSYLKKM